MENKKSNVKTTFSTVQNTLAGIACSFYLIYRFYLSDDKVVKDLGAAYPWFIMIWLIVMFMSAGLSGPKLLQFFVKYAPVITGVIKNIKKDATDSE